MTCLGLLDLTATQDQLGETFTWAAELSWRSAPGVRPRTQAMGEARDRMQSDTAPRARLEVRSLGRKAEREHWCQAAEARTQAFVAALGPAGAPR